MEFSTDAVALTSEQATFFELWRARLAGRRMPARRDFDVQELKPWLGDLHLLEVEAGGEDFRYRIYATNFSQFLDREMTGRLMSETPEPPLRAVGLFCYREAFLAGLPYLIKRPTVIQGRLAHATIRDYLVLPLGDDGVTVDRLLVLCEIRSNPRVHADYVEFFPLVQGAVPYRHATRAIIAGTAPPLRPSARLG